MAIVNSCKLFYRRHHLTKDSEKREDLQKQFFSKWFCIFGQKQSSESDDHIRNVCKSLIGLYDKNI